MGGAWNGDVLCGAEAPPDWPNAKPPPGVPGGWGKFPLPLVAGEAGWLEPNAKGLLGAVGEVKEKGVD